MPKQVAITGLTTVLRNLNREIEGIKNRSRKGLIEAGILVREEGQRITPVATGNLVNSWYGPVIETKESGTIAAEIGLTAAYAPYVHEMVDANFKKPGAQAKFLETPLKEYSSQILQIIRNNAKVRR